MHFGFALELSNVDLLNIDLLDAHLDLLDTDIPSKYFVFSIMSSRPTNVFWDARVIEKFSPHKDCDNVREKKT